MHVQGIVDVCSYMHVQEKHAKMLRICVTTIIMKLLAIYVAS